MRFLKWLYPGMKIKRWILLGLVGLILFGIGASIFTSEALVLMRLFGLALLAVGVLSVIVGAFATIRSLLDAVSPSGGKRDLVETVFTRRHLEKGPKVVAIGGGTGLSMLLHGLKQYTTNVAAIVTVADDGGSSGRLREEFDMPPPGDIRNCLVALADAEPLMQKLFQYRFAEGTGLHGHNFGNLFITAMTQITGDFQRAVQASSRVLAIRGSVIPSTLTKVRLVAEHSDGSVTEGETKISKADVPIRRLYLEPANCQVAPEAIVTLRDADVIIFGPGSLYTSIIPNLLVPGLVDAIMESRAQRIYVCNVMTQYRETANFKASDHVRTLLDHTHPGLLHAVIVNNKEVPSELLERYRQEQAFPVIADADTISALGCRVVLDDVISTENYVRHNAEKLARLIVQLSVGMRRTF